MPDARRHSHRARRRAVAAPCRAGARPRAARASAARSSALPSRRAIGRRAGRSTGRRFRRSPPPHGLGRALPGRMASPHCRATPAEGERGRHSTAELGTHGHLHEHFVILDAVDDDLAGQPPAFLEAEPAIERLCDRVRGANLNDQLAIAGIDAQMPRWPSTSGGRCPRLARRATETSRAGRHVTSKPGATTTGRGSGALRHLPRRRRPRGPLPGPRAPPDSGLPARRSTPDRSRSRPAPQRRPRAPRRCRPRRRVRPF